MLDKKLIAKNFQKSINTYDENAIVQKKTARELVLLLERKKYSSILEIGSYSGILTKEIVKNIDFKSYLALDIIESFDFIKNLDEKITFKKADFENFETEKKFDLIISNASLQWCEDFDFLCKKLKSLAKKGGVVAISIFSKGNLAEIKETFNVGLDYPDLDKIKRNFPDGQIIQKEYTLNFSFPLEILRHLKLTGVNSISKKQFGISEIKKNLQKLNGIYNNTLTYKAVFIIFQCP